LHTEKEAIKKPITARSARDAVSLKTIKRGKKKIKRDINDADKHAKLWPSQPKQPTINVPPPPRAGIDFHKLNLP
jgi:hypothetical protein